MKKYDAYLEAKENLKYWKDKELELRTKLCNELLEGKEVGTHDFIKNGYKLKAVKKINHKIDADILSSIWNDLSEDEQAAIKMEPKLLVREYKGVADHTTLDHAITVTPAIPTLTVEYVTE